MKVLRTETTTDIVETKLSYPIFIHLQDEHAVDNTYIRYTETERLSIEWKFGGGVTVTRQTHNPKMPIAEFYFNNLTSTDDFNDCLMDLEDFMDKIN